MTREAYVEAARSGLAWGAGGAGGRHAPGAAAPEAWRLLLAPRRSLHGLLRAAWSEYPAPSRLLCGWSPAQESSIEDRGASADPHVLGSTKAWT